MHTILFSGHMIDAKDRKIPRFPANKENKARTAIKNILLEQHAKYRQLVTGIAGGASGGDILFHELCSEMGIPSEVYLALPAADYKKKSVSFAGKNWEDRFEELMATHPLHILQEAGNNQNSIWEQTNLWMLDESLKEGGENMTLIALWNGKEGDGKGGTSHMVEAAGAAGASIQIIDSNKL